MNSGAARSSEPPGEGLGSGQGEGSTGVGTQAFSSALRVGLGSRDQE